MQYSYDVFIRRSCTAEQYQSQTVQHKPKSSHFHTKTLQLRCDFCSIFVSFLIDFGRIPVYLWIPHHTWPHSAFRARPPADGKSLQDRIPNTPAFSKAENIGGDNPNPNVRRQRRDVAIPPRRYLDPPTNANNGNRTPKYSRLNT